MPRPSLGVSLKKLGGLRSKAKLPAEIDARLATSLSSIKKLPQMPLGERKEKAREQSTVLNDILMTLNQMGSSVATSMPDTVLISALETTIEALAEVAEGVGEAASNIDLSV